MRRFRSTWNLFLIKTKSVIKENLSYKIASSFFSIQRIVHNSNWSEMLHSNREYCIEINIIYFLFLISKRSSLLWVWKKHLSDSLHDPFQSDCMQYISAWQPLLLDITGLAKNIPITNIRYKCVQQVFVERPVGFWLSNGIRKC